MNLGKSTFTANVPPTAGPLNGTQQKAIGLVAEHLGVLADGIGQTFTPEAAQIALSWAYQFQSAINGLAVVPTNVKTGQNY